jgi:hypothetical protein
VIGRRDEMLQVDHPRFNQRQKAELHRGRIATRVGDQASCLDYFAMHLGQPGAMPDYQPLLRGAEQRIKVSSNGYTGSGFLGPKYQPFGIGSEGGLPPFSSSGMEAEREPAAHDQVAQTLAFLSRAVRAA